MYYDKYIDMHTIYKEYEDENYKINIIEVEEPDIFSKIRNEEISGQLDQTVVVLKDKKLEEIVMSDSWMECKTNINFVNNAKGNVLIAGLGIGLIVLAIQDNPDVKNITIIEKDESLKNIVLKQLSKHLNDKINIIISDINEFEPKEKYDTIYFDIWNNISGENLDEMNNLSDKFKNHLNKNGTIDSWRYKKTLEQWEEDNEYYEDDDCGFY